MGGHTYKNMLEVPAELTLCADRTAYLDLLHQKDDLSRHLKGRETPIYLAKLELIEATDRVFLGSVTNLPFEQRLNHDRATQAAGKDRMDITTSVEALEFWQKPM